MFFSSEQITWLWPAFSNSMPDETRPFMKLNYRLNPLLPVLAVLLFSLFSTTFALAAASSPLRMETEDERLVTWDLQADTVTSHSNFEILEASGNVTISRGTEYLRADFARYYMSTRWVFLSGNVVVRMGKDELRAEEAEFDLRSRVGWLKNGTIFMAGPHAYLSGDRIDKHWGDIYSFRQAKITTCDGESPAWSFTAEEAVVEIDGYARLSRASFQVADQPVIYTPYFFMPVKTRRQSGFLLPDYGKSTTKGFYYNQPYFWAINDTSDLTVNEFIMQDRGFMHGVEYRARPFTDTAAWIRFDWLYDSVRETNDWGTYGGDGLLRTNRDRYWLRGMLDTRLPDPNWRLKVDLDYTSDQYFLREFKNDFSGYNRSRDELFNWFSRDLSERAENRESGVLLTRDWDRFSVAMSAWYSQDPSLGHGNTPHTDDTTVQRLPQFDAFLHKGRIVNELPLEAEASFQGGYMYRRSGTRGARYEVNPKITLPMTSQYGSLIATAGVRETYYDTERRSYTQSNVPQTGAEEYRDNRTVPEFSLKAFTELARVYEYDTAPLKLDTTMVGKSKITHVRHSIQPRLEYNYRANEDQSRLPYYSEEDRLLPQRELLYSLSNVITRRRETVVMVKGPDGEEHPEIRTSYDDLLRFRISQAYDFREEIRNDQRDTYNRRPFSDIFTDLDLRLTGKLSLTNRSYWSPYMNMFTRTQTGLRFSEGGIGSFGVSYDHRNKFREYDRWRNNKIRYWQISGTVVAFDPFVVNAVMRYDVENTANQETEVHVIYNHQCFQLIGRVMLAPEENHYQIMVVLFGLGDK